MDPIDVITETAEAEPAGMDHDLFRNRAALLIALIAALLAIGGLGGGNATDEMISANIHASDTWAFFQAKNVRQTAYEIAAEDLRQQLASGALTGEARAHAEKTLASYDSKIARYDDEPDPAHPDDPTAGEGKKQLQARAKGFEAARARAEAQDGNFDLAEVFLQLAIVLGSVAILALNRRVLITAGVAAAIGLVLTLNGFFLLFALPF
jgi:hypothetical protein